MTHYRALADGSIDKGAVEMRIGRLTAIFSRFDDPLQRLANAWDALVADAAEVNVFAERWFMMAAIRHLPEGRSAHRLELWDGEGRAARLVGLIPLMLSRRYGRLPVQHVANWRHHNGFLGTPLVAAGHEREVATALLDALGALGWARAFLHLEGLVEHGPVHRGLMEAAAAAGRRCDTVHRTERALLESRLSPSEYFVQTVRKKKRKELKRQSNRLNDLGLLVTRRLETAAELGPWCDTFLALEQSGWKGTAGSALGSATETAGFFRDAMRGAHAAGRLEMLRLDLDGRPIAMLINFLAPPGAFSFKIAFDEAFARFSPGVLLQIENLAVLDRPDIDWMDSCAAEDHPMINSLWGERRSIVRVTTPLGGSRSSALFHLCRTVERGAALARRVRGRTRPTAKAA